MSEYGDGVVFAAFHEQPAGTLRQKEYAHEHGGGGQCDDSQHQAPMAAGHSTEGRIGCEPGIANKGDHDSDRDHQLVHRDHRPPHLLRGNFGQIERRRERCDADGGAENEARPDQDIRAGGQGTEKRTDNKNERADQDRLFSPEVAGEIAADQGAEDRAPQQHADDRFHRPIGNLEILLDELLCSGNDADIEAEEESGQRRGKSDEIDDGPDLPGDGSVHKRWWSWARVVAMLLKSRRLMA